MSRPRRTTCPALKTIDECQIYFKTSASDTCIDRIECHPLMFTTDTLERKHLSQEWPHCWSRNTRASTEKIDPYLTAPMIPDLALSLLSDNNSTQAQEQPVNRQPATNILPTTTLHITTMDPDLARSLLQNDTSVPKFSHPKPTQPANPNQISTQRNPPTIPRPPSFPPPRTPPSRLHQKLLKKLYPRPGVQPRDYAQVFLHPALGYAAFDGRKNPRGLPYPWCEICGGDCWCVDRNVIWRLPRGGGLGGCGCGCGVM